MSDIDGTKNGDSIQGTAGDDRINGKGGDDWLTGLGGDDRLYGGAGTDYLDGGLGADRLYGNAGNDNLVDEQGGADRMWGGDGNDSITVRRASNSSTDQLRLDGEAGDDYITYYGSYENRVTLDIAGGEGNDTITASYGTADVDAGTGNDVIQLRYMRDGRVDAGDGDDTLTIVHPYGGQLRVDMGTGDDRVTLQPAAPYTNASYVMTLGAGQDTLALQPFSDSQVYVPNLTLTDFIGGVDGDRIDLSSYLAKGLTNWGGNNPFASGHLQLVQNGASTLLQIDMDGEGNSWQTLATLLDVQASTITADNFIGGFDPSGESASAASFEWEAISASGPLYLDHAVAALI